jgi:hypothetical protein
MPIRQWRSTVRTAGAVGLKRLGQFQPAIHVRSSGTKLCGWENRIGHYPPSHARSEGDGRRQSVAFAASLLMNAYCRRHLDSPLSKIDPTLPHTSDAKSQSLRSPEVGSQSRGRSHLDDSDLLALSALLGEHASSCRTLVTGIDASRLPLEPAANGFRTEHATVG